MKIVLGQFVTPKAGKDQGTFYLVIGYKGSRLLLANGRDKTVSNPKPKNPRHVTAYKALADDLGTKLREGNQITDEQIRQAIKDWQQTSKLSEAGEEG